MYGLNDYFASNIQRQSYFFWNHFVLVYDDCTAKKQPIKDSDIAKCILNALKMEETKVISFSKIGKNLLIGRSTRFRYEINTLNNFQYIKI